LIYGLCAYSTWYHVQKQIITNFPRLVIGSCNQNLTMWFLTCIKVTCKVTLSSQCLWGCFHPLSPLSVVYMQSEEILLNIDIKCWVSVFNAQGSRPIIVVVQVGPVKTYVTTVEALREKETRYEIQFTSKIGGKKLVWLQVISLWEILPATFLMSYYGKTNRSCPLIAGFLPPNCGILWITLLVMGLAP